MSHAFPQLFCFDILPSSSFLCVLSATPTSVEGGLQISNEDIDLFKKLKAQPKKISEAIKAFKKHKGVGANAESGVMVNNGLVAQIFYSGWINGGLVSSEAVQRAHCAGNVKKKKNTIFFND